MVLFLLTYHYLFSELLELLKLMYAASDFNLQTYQIFLQTSPCSDHIPEFYLHSLPMNNPMFYDLNTHPYYNKY